MAGTMPEEKVCKGLGGGQVLRYLPKDPPLDCDKLLRSLEAGKVGIC